MIEPLGEISNIESKKIFRAYALNMTIGFYTLMRFKNFLQLATRAKSLLSQSVCLKSYF